MEVVLEDNGLKEFIDSDVPKPRSRDDALLDAWCYTVIFHHPCNPPSRTLEGLFRDL